MPIHVFPSLRNLILSYSLFMVALLNRIFFPLVSSHLIGYASQPHLRAASFARFGLHARVVRIQFPAALFLPHCPGISPSQPLFACVIAKQQEGFRFT